MIIERMQLITQKKQITSTKSPLIPAYIQLESKESNKQTLGYIEIKQKFWSFYRTTYRSLHISSGKSIQSIDSSIQKKFLYLSDKISYTCSKNWFFRMKNFWSLSKRLTIFAKHFILDVFDRVLNMHVLKKVYF